MKRGALIQRSESCFLLGPKGTRSHGLKPPFLLTMFLIVHLMLKKNWSKL